MFTVIHHGFFVTKCWEIHSRMQQHEKKSAFFFFFLFFFFFSYIKSLGVAPYTRVRRIHATYTVFKIIRVSGTKHHQKNHFYSHTIFHLYFLSFCQFLVNKIIYIWKNNYSGKWKKKERRNLGYYFYILITCK